MEDGEVSVGEFGGRIRDVVLGEEGLDPNPPSKRTVGDLGPSIPDPEIGGPWPSVPREPFLTGERGLVLGVIVCLKGSDMGITGEVMGIGIDRKGREGEMEMGFGVIELVGMFGVTVLAVTFVLGIFELGVSLLITGLGVGLIELDVTIGVVVTVMTGVGITGLGRVPMGSSSSMIE